MNLLRRGRRTPQTWRMWMVPQVQGRAGDEHSFFSPPLCSVLKRFLHHYRTAIQIPHTALCNVELPRIIIRFNNIAEALGFLRSVFSYKPTCTPLEPPLLLTITSQILHAALKVQTKLVKNRSPLYP